MKATIAILAGIVVLALGLLFGFNIGISRMQKSAIANRIGHYEYVPNEVGSRSREFAWGPWTDENQQRE